MRIGFSVVLILVLGGATQTVAQTAPIAAYMISGPCLIVTMDLNARRPSVHLNLVLGV